jgi:MFS family permease
MTAVPTVAASRPSPWAAMAHRTFRWIWAATIVSNIGGWSQDVGEAWLMTSLTTSALLISAIQAASSAASVFLSLPGGALADVTNNRRVILLMEGWATLVTAGMALLARLDAFTPGYLVLFSFAASAGSALAAPAWQALTAELVPLSDLPGAVTLNALGINISRAVGPAVGGLIVSAAGPWAAFAANALSFVGVLIVVAAWRPPRRTSALDPERLQGAVLAGIRFALHAPPFRAVLMRTAIFMICASALWALLPVLVSQELKQGPKVYGLLLACIGAGAMAIVPLVKPIRTRLSATNRVAAGSLVMAVAFGLLAVVHNVPALAATMLIAGGAWVLVMAGLNIAAQSAVAPWVRARALAIYLTAFFAASTVGSLVWGAVATRLGVDVAMGIAGAASILGIFAGARHRLSDQAADFSPSHHWDDPQTPMPLPPDAGSAR